MPHLHDESIQFSEVPIRGSLDMNDSNVGGMAIRILLSSWVAGNTSVLKGSCS